MIIEQEYLTVAEVAHLLKIKKSYIYELIGRGELKAIRISERRTRIPVSSVQEFANSKVDSQRVEKYNKVFQPPKRGRRPKH